MNWQTGVEPFQNALKKSEKRHKKNRLENYTVVKLQSWKKSMTEYHRTKSH